MNNNPRLPILIGCSSPIPASITADDLGLQGGRGGAGQCIKSATTWRNSRWALPIRKYWADHGGANGNVNGADQNCLRLRHSVRPKSHICRRVDASKLTIPEKTEAPLNATAFGDVDLDDEEMKLTVSTFSASLEKVRPLRYS